MTAKEKALVELESLRDWLLDQARKTASFSPERKTCQDWLTEVHEQIRILRWDVKMGR